ncbi:bridging integrator 3-like [Paramacrobiotus metropolitanus]|uniref:bridging integrator 3-like n=1 Tax=Paramacrobiotus metropolitanus TaxID=2943436 RepID=UPI002445BE5B|nr:bridging integrator 3-like [Paramacrobiotus metropolitanus]
MTSPSTGGQNDAPLASQRIQQLTSDIQRMEDTTRKLLRQVKQYTDFILALQKLENKCASDLLQAPLCSSSKHADAKLKSTVKNWSSSLNAVDAHCKSLSASCSAQLSKPIKEFLDVLGNYHKALKRREALLQEHERAVARWRKVEKEGKFSVTTAKYNEIRSHLVETEVALDSMHSRMIHDLSTLSAKSGDVFHPLLASFADIQKQHATASYDSINQMLSQRAVPISERQLEADMLYYRRQLEGLSIVKAPSATAHGNNGGQDMSQEQKSFMVRSLTALELPPGLKACEIDAHCDGKQRCDSTVKQCIQKESPEFPLHLLDVSCETHYQCPFLYRCANATCTYAFFRACRSSADCAQATGWDYDCRERSDQFPGRLCYRKCLMDRDCYDCNGSTCRYPEYLQKIIACCDGYCSKKIACDDFR